MHAPLPREILTITVDEMSKRLDTLEATIQENARQAEAAEPKPEQ